MTAAPPPARPSTAGGTSGGRASLLAPAALVVGPALVTSVVAAVLISGGATPLLLSRVVTRVLLDLSSAAVLGILVVLLLLLGTDDPRRPRLLDVAAVAAGIWTVTAASTAFLLHLGQAPPISSPAFGASLVSFLAEVVPGRTWLLATAAAAVLTAGLIAVRSRRGLQLLSVLAVGALVPVAAQSAPSDQSLAGVRMAGSAALVVLVALGTWIGAAAVTAGLGRARVGPGSRRLAVVCAASAVLSLSLGGVQRLPLGVAAGVVLVLALAAEVAVGRRSVLVQLVLLGIGGGLAAAARVLQTAASSSSPRTTPAEILTGAPLPGPPDVGRLLGGWQPDALWVLVGAGLLIAYVAAVVRLRRGGSGWPAGRVCSWSLGVVLLLWLTCGGPAVYAPVLLSVDAAQHVAFVAVVPLLLAGGAPLRLWNVGRGVPEAAARPLVHPVAAAVLAVGAFVALFGTEMLRWSVTDAVGTEWGLLQCLLAGALLVGTLLTGGRRAGVSVTLALLLVEMLVAAVPAIGPGLLLADWFGAMGWGADALADQRLGAVLTWAVAAAATLVLLGVTLRRRAGGPSPARPDVPASPPRRLEVSA